MILLLPLQILVHQAYLGLGLGGIDAGQHIHGQARQPAYRQPLPGTCLGSAQLAHLVLQVVELLEQRKLKQTLLTHHHEDHGGNAAAVKQGCNATVFGHPVTKAKIFPVRPLAVTPTRQVPLLLISRPLTQAYQVVKGPNSGDRPPQGEA